MRARTETPKRYRYTGKERDTETGLYYYGARYYVPWLGRWASCDPIGLADSVNVYLYVNGNPIAAVDSTGYDSENPVVQNAPLGNASLPGGAPDQTPPPAAPAPPDNAPPPAPPAPTPPADTAPPPPLPPGVSGPPPTTASQPDTSAGREIRPSTAEGIARERSEKILNYEIPPEDVSLADLGGGGIVGEDYLGYSLIYRIKALFAPKPQYLDNEHHVKTVPWNVDRSAELAAAIGEVAQYALPGPEGLEAEALDTLVTSKLGAAEASKLTNKIIVDANVLVRAADLADANALAAIRAGEPTVTLSQLREFLDVTSEVQQTRRAQFLLDEGITPLSTKYGQLTTPGLRETFWDIARQQGGRDTTADAALVIHGIQSGYTIVTRDMRLINTINVTLKIPGVKFTPVK